MRLLLLASLFLALPPVAAHAADCPAGQTLMEYEHDRIVFGAKSRGCLDAAGRRVGKWTFEKLSAFSGRFDPTDPVTDVDDELLRAEITFDADVRHGPASAWYPNGQLARRGEMRSDRPEGTWTWWYDDGTVARKAHYDAARLHGPFEAFGRTGVRTAQFSFSAGRPHGVCKTYDPSSGKLAATETYAAGLRSGPAAYFRADGSKRDAGEWRDDAVHGRWTAWHQNGAVAEERTWNRGIREGRWRFLRRDGSLIAEGEMAGGKPVGTWKIAMPGQAPREVTP